MIRHRRYGMVDAAACEFVSYKNRRLRRRCGETLQMQERLGRQRQIVHGFKNRRGLTFHRYR
jgi:hypothetical protein